MPSSPSKSQISSTSVLVVTIQHHHQLPAKAIILAQSPTPSSSNSNRSPDPLIGKFISRSHRLQHHCERNPRLYSLTRSLPSPLTRSLPSSLGLSPSSSKPEPATATSQSLASTQISTDASYSLKILLNIAIQSPPKRLCRLLLFRKSLPPSTFSFSLLSDLVDVATSSLLPTQTSAATTLASNQTKGDKRTEEEENDKKKNMKQETNKCLVS